MKKQNILFLFLLLFVISCDKNSNDDSNNDNNVETGSLGEIGNAWDVKVDGKHDLSTEIIAKEGDVYTLQVSYAKLFTKDLKFGFSGNEIMDYVYSKDDLSKPFTMVKFDAEVGDTYTAEINGNYHYREVFEKKTYHIPALNKDLETIGVFETIPYEIPNVYFGYNIRHIYWYWHPTYGLVCVDFLTEEGELINVEFINIDL